MASFVRFGRCLSMRLAVAAFKGRTSHTQPGLSFFVRSMSMGLTTNRQSFASSETVFALSSGYGKCGVAVIRLSGPSTRQALLKLLAGQQFVAARKACLRQLCHPDNGDVLDQALVLWFPGPESFTGEDVAELHVHGSVAVVAAIYSALSSLPGLKMAEPGDFTRRAFYNGKLDLTAVEGLADLIHAETEAQRQQALRQLKGELSDLYNDWSQRLLKCVADVEAVIDFGEDEQIGDAIFHQVSVRLKQLEKEMSEHLSDKRCGERLRSGVHIAIVGAPNVGKSSLLNYLCQRPAAIVSPHAGTTRDVLDCTLNLSGYPIVLSDTAGLRDTSDPVEQEGVRRATQKVSTADLTLAVVDVSSDWQRLLPVYSSLLTAKQNGSEAMLVLNKTDLLSGHNSVEEISRHFPGVSCCAISCKTKEGMEQFLDIITELVKKLCGNPLSGNPSLTQARHRHHLQHCVQFLTSYHEQEDIVLAAEELRMALRSLGQITGKVGAEDILDVIFRDFCIGK